MRLILLLVVLFGCFYFNESKHTVFVENIFPNYNDWVVINDFAVDDFTIATFNVGTLNVNSEEGVNIITSSSISLYGASISFAGQTVSFSTSSPDSVVNIDAAATLDILANSATFSSEEGDVRFEALTDFELISNGDLIGEYTGSFAVNGDILEFQSSKGGSHFLTHSSFISQATTTSVDAGNLLLFNATEFNVQANLAIDIFAGEFIADVDTFELTARRNNILLQTGTILDVGGDFVNINARDLFTITSLESQVIMTSPNDATYTAANNVKIFSDSEVTFNAYAEGLVLSFPDSISLYSNEGIAIQSTSTASDSFLIESSNLSVSGESIVEETTNGNIIHDTRTFTSNTFGQHNIYAQRNLQFGSDLNLNIDAAAGINLNADRGVLSLANSPSAPTTAFINFDTIFNNVFSGSSVRLNPSFIDFAVPNGNFRVATSQEDRDSEINVDTTTQFSANTNLFFVTGGDVQIDANDLDLTSSADVRFTATGFPSSYILIQSFNHTDDASGDISFNGGQFLLNAADNLQFASGSYFSQSSEDNLRMRAANDINFNVFSNMTIDTTLDAQYTASDSIVIGDNILQQFTVDSGFAHILSNAELRTLATENITVVGTNINFDVDGELQIEADTYTSAARRFSIVSGDQVYNYDIVNFNSQNTLLQSLPNQDITLSSSSLSVEGDTNFVGRTLSLNDQGNGISIFTHSTFTMETAEEAPIHINSPSVEFNSGSHTVRTDQDLLISSTNSYELDTTIAQYQAINDITHTTSSDFLYTISNLFNADSEDFTSYSEGATTLTLSGTLTEQSSDRIDYLSRWGNINVARSTVAFTGSADSHFGVDALQTNNFTADSTLSLDSENFQILGNLVVNADLNVEYNAARDLVFFGSEFDIVSFGSLLLNTPQVLTMKSSVITMISEDELSITTSEGVSLIAGLDKDLTFSQTSAAGVFAIEANNLLISSNNVLDINSGATFTHVSNGVDSFGNSILLQTSAMSAGIDVDVTASFTATITDNILFVVDDVTNRGGDDINLTTTSASFTVTTGGALGAENPVPLLTDSLDQGIFFYASGSEYDPILGQPVGILYRTEGQKANAAVGTIGITSANNVYYNSEVYNEILSHDSSVTITADTADVSYFVGGDMSIESDRSDASYTSGGSTSITVGQTVQIQSAAGTSSLSHDGTYFSTAGAFEAVADRGGVEFSLSGPSNQMQTSASSINLEGGKNGRYQYTTDTYSATTIDLYAYSTAIFRGNDEDVTATRNMYYESSKNNDISVTSDTSSDVEATNGNIVLSAGLDHAFTAVTDSDFTAGSDLSFYSSGSFQYIAQEALNILSVNNQIYVAKAHAYFESLGTVNIGSDAVPNTPLVTIYAGGDNLRSGVELTAVQDFSFDSNFNTNIQGRNWYSTSDSTSQILTGGSMTLQSTGTNGIGKDVTFTAGESLDLYSEQNLILTAKTLKFEYDDLLFTTGSDLLLTATKGIALSGSSFSTTSNAHTISSKTGLSISANSDVHFDAATTLSFVSKTTTTWQSLDQIEVSAGQAMSISSTGTNSPISFDTKGQRSSLFIQAQENVITTAGDSIDYTAEHGFLALINGELTFTIGDSFTSTNGGDIILSGREDVSFIASNPSSAGSDFQLTSEGTFHVEVGTDLVMTVSSDLFIEPDVDLTFEGGKIDNDVNDNVFSFVIDNQISLTTGNNFNFNANRVLFGAATYDSVATGVNPENGDGIRLSTSGEFSDIDVLSSSGSVLTSAIGDIILQSDNAVTLRSAGTVQLLSKGSNGISFNTNEVPTPILAVSRNGITLSGDDLVNLQSFGTDTSSGYIDLRATGYANLGEANPIINGTFGIGFFSALSNIDINVMDASLRMANLHSFLAFPSVNGSLTLQADGQNVEGVGINVESTIITVLAELDVAFEAANIHFFDYGISLYEFEFDFFFFSPFNNFNRPTISSAKDQTYVSYGSNAFGNAIELTSSIPNAPMLFHTAYVNFYSGGTTVVQGEQGTYMYSEYQTVITSANSVIIQGDGLNSDIGIYLTTREFNDPYTYNAPPSQLGSNIEFNSKIDSYILSAGKIIAEAQNSLVFVTGPNGVIDLNFDAGALFESSNGAMNVNVDDMDFRSNSEINVESGTTTFSSGDDIFISATGYYDGRGNIVVGDPSIDHGYNLAPFSANVVLAADEVDFRSNYIDIANTNMLEIPRATAVPFGCSAATRGATIIISVFPYEYLCSCIVEPAGWGLPNANIIDDWNCFIFYDVFSY